MALHQFLRVINQCISDEHRLIKTTETTLLKIDKQINKNGN